MPELTILRHARAGEGSMDYTRMLTSDGWRQAEAAADALKAAHFHAGRVLCSPALRTHETLTAVRSVIPIPEASILYDKRVYNAEGSALAELVDEHLPASPLLIVGHNPGLEHLARWLTGDVTPLGTACWVRLSLDEVAPGVATVKDMFGP
jgi:phosphohistidine phosphatase